MRSMPARKAWVRKSGVVSIKTFWPLRESRTDVRMRLSRGSVEVHTAQWQPMVGTPMEVPEPSTVSRNLVECCEMLGNEFADMLQTRSARCESRQWRD